jgi:KaiC/GvpD/RAD55 family RecA-like ATPase
MRKKIQLVPSGISLVDGAWGGFYRGGTYLLVGPRKSGRTLIGLQYALESASQKEVCLYFTNMRPKDLMIHAASIDFDLQEYMNHNLIIVVRVAPPVELNQMGNPDEYLAEYMNDIVTVVEQYQPNKIVFDEITPFVGFKNLVTLNDSFMRMRDVVEESGITSLFIVGDPAAPAAQNIVDLLASSSTGIIYLKNEHDERANTITITPNIGHTEGKFSAEYQIEPYKGITINFEKNKTVTASAEPQRIKNSKYISLSDIEIPEDKLIYSNIYPSDDFYLIINNQIALFRSTGQAFMLLSFKLIENNFITVKQLANAVRLSSDKKDKICILGDKVVVLITNGRQKEATSIIGKIKYNIPYYENISTEELLKYVYFYSIKVDEEIESAEQVLNKLNAFEQLHNIF